MIPETVPVYWPCSILLMGIGKEYYIRCQLGRDADTIATMVGALAGAYKGVDGLRPEWVEK